MRTTMQNHIEWLKDRMVVSKQMEKSLLDKEKQQIIDAYITSMRNERDLLTIMSAEDYYKETYNQDK
ncbi:MAG: hypothetical protein ACOVJ5_00230 [Gloeomargaritales cyanobacterium]